MLASSRCCQIRRLPWMLLVSACLAGEDLPAVGACRGCQPVKTGPVIGALSVSVCLAGEDLPAVDAVGVDAVPGQHHGRAESGACRGRLSVWMPASEDRPGHWCLPWALSVWMQQQVNIMAGLTLCRAESARSGACRCRCRLAGEDLPAVGAVGVGLLCWPARAAARSGACRGRCRCGCSSRSTSWPG